MKVRDLALLPVLHDEQDKNSAILKLPANLWRGLLSFLSYA